MRAAAKSGDHESRRDWPILDAGNEAERAFLSSAFQK
jgi:hypothetical protein